MARIGILTGILLGMTGAAGAEGVWFPGLLTLSSGTWSTYGRLDGFTPSGSNDGTSRIEYNTLLAVNAYYSLFGLSAHTGAPFKWTAKRFDSDETEDFHRLAMGDFSHYFGRRFGPVEPRIGIVIPLGYDTRKTGWIGSGNTKLMLGTGLNSKISEISDAMELAADLEWTYALDDGLAHAGSWGVFADGKVFFRPTRELKYGAELFVFWSRDKWEWNRGRAEWKASVIPNLYIEYYLASKIALGLKTGHSLWSHSKLENADKTEAGVNSFNASLSLSLYR